MENQKRTMRTPVIQPNNDVTEKQKNAGTNTAAAKETTGKPQLKLYRENTPDASRIEAVRATEKRLLPAMIALCIGYAILILYQNTIQTRIAFEFGNRYALIWLVLYILLIGVAPLAVGLIRSGTTLKQEDLLPQQLWTVPVTGILGMPLAVLATALSLTVEIIGRGLGMKHHTVQLTPYYAIIRHGSTWDRVLLVLIVLLGAIVFECLLRLVLQNGVMSASRIPYSTLFTVIFSLITASIWGFVVPCLVLGLVSGLLFRKERAIFGNILLHAIFMLTYMAAPFYDNYIMQTATSGNRFDATEMLIGLLSACIVIPLYLLLDSTFQKSLLHDRDWIIFVHEKKTYPKKRLFLILMALIVILRAVVVAP